MGTEVPLRPSGDGRLGPRRLPGEDEERVCGGHGCPPTTRLTINYSGYVGLGLSLPIRCIWQGGDTRMGPTGLIVQAGRTRTASGILDGGGTERLQRTEPGGLYLQDRGRRAAYRVYCGGCAGFGSDEGPEGVESDGHRGGLNEGSSGAAGIAQGAEDKE